MDIVNIRERHIKQLGVMRGWLDGKGYYSASRALELVSSLEKGTRKDGETPKLHHQLCVAQLVSTLIPHLLHPEESVTTSFLHDVLEDHGLAWSLGELRVRFGELVGDATWALSKKSVGLTKTYDLYFEEMSNSPIASIVKLADRAHNLQSMVGVFTLEKQKAYLEEVNEWFFPMIKRARRNFPSQYHAYENLKILLLCQCELIEHIHQAM